MENIKPVVHLKVSTIYSFLQVQDVASPVLQELWEYLDTTLSYEIKNSFFIKATSNKAFIRDQWDGKKHLFSVKTGRFLTGLLSCVKAALDAYDILYSIEDTRPTYNTIPTPATGLTQRIYQIEAVDALIENKRGILFARPRSGKTIIEIMLHERLGLLPHLSICQSIDIARQTKKKFEIFFPTIPIGLIGDGVVDIQGITIATIQSLTAAYTEKYKLETGERIEQIPVTAESKASVRNLVETSKVVWVDECHHAAASTYSFILGNKVYAAEYIIGSSGTPYREDNTDKFIEGLLGPIVYEIGYTKLVEEGYLVPPNIHIIKMPKDDTIVEEHYQSIYKAAITENLIRNDVIKRIAIDLNKKGKSCMILVTKLGHGKELEKTIPNSRFTYSKATDREQCWTLLHNKQLMTLITTLGDEGLDIPSLDATIIAGGGESAIKVFQRLRCMTPFENKDYKKETAIVVDFHDPYKYLKRHSNKRKKLYKSEKVFRVFERDAK